MVRMAANNIRPLDFRYGEIESLTETLRTKGRPTLDLELLSLFFKGCWQGWNRYSRAVEYALITDRLDKYEAWARCREDKAYEHTLLLRMRGFLHYRPVPCRTSNIKDAPCGVFPPDSSVYRGRSAASSRAFSKPKPRWSTKAGIQIISMLLKKKQIPLNPKSDENLPYQQKR